MFVLVRHGHAGEKKAWPLSDAERPLSERGRQQAEGLAQILAPVGPPRLLSSSYRRCRQTLMPLAERLGVAIETTDLLAPDADPQLLDRLLHDPDVENAVLCTHGETLVALMQRWHRLGTVSMPLKRKEITKAVTEKGGAWIVDDDGTTRTAHYLRPLHVTPAVIDISGLIGGQPLAGQSLAAT